MEKIRNINVEFEIPDVFAPGWSMPVLKTLPVPSEKERLDYLRTYLLKALES